MKKIASILCVTAMALPMMAIPPAISAPILASAPIVSHSSGITVVDVQYRRDNRGHYRSSRNHYRPRHYRRNNNGDVAAGIIGGLAAGAILGSMASQPTYAAPPRNYHVEWCLGKYRSYDVRSNTYQPFNGPRQYCSSPYR